MASWLWEPNPTWMTTRFGFQPWQLEKHPGHVCMHASNPNMMEKCRKRDCSVTLPHRGSGACFLSLFLSPSSDHTCLLEKK